MKINVLNIDKQIITFDVDPNDLVGNVKALLKVERQELLYDEKEMSNNVKLSELGVQDGDLIVIVPDSAPNSSSSTTVLGLNPDGSAMNLEAFQQEIQHNSNLVADGSAMNLEAFQQEIQHNSNLVAHLVQSDPEFSQAAAKNDLHRLQELSRQHNQQKEQFQQKDGELGLTNLDYVPRNDGDVSLAFLAEKETISHLLDKERYSEQKPEGGFNDVNEEVKIQTNGGSNCAEENDHHHHVLNSSDKESSTASIQKVGSDDHDESEHFASHVHADSDMLANHPKGTEVRNPELLDSSLSPNPPQTTTKGHGLKKWRRIRREFTKDPNSNLDSTKVLKRGSANITDMKIPDDGSVSSTNAFVKSPGYADLFSNPAPSSSYKMALGTTFSAGADDSEDRSSKSSTAASAPTYRHEVAKAAGYHYREKHRVKNVSGRHLNSSGQRFQLGKGHTQDDASKKPRGESINVDKENSLSSMESDSRSYSTMFVRGSSSVNSDQVQSGRSANYDEEDAYDQQTCEVQSSKELQDGHGKNGNLSPDCSAELSCSANIGKSKDRELSREYEPLFNSILLLQSAQEALEREVQMFKEIGKGVNSFCDNSGKATGVSAYSTFVGPETCVDHSDGSVAKNNHVQTLERQLDEAQVTLKEKDLKVIELEKMVKTLCMESTPQADRRNNLWQDMEAELESVFKLKVEAEVQYVAMTGSRKDLGAFVEDQIKLLRDQKFEASRRLIADAGNKGSISQGQAQLDNLYTEDEELQKMQSGIGRYSSYLVIQLVLMVLIVGLFLLRVLPKSATVVPT